MHRLQINYQKKLLNLEKIQIHCENEIFTVNFLIRREKHLRTVKEYLEHEKHLRSMKNNLRSGKAIGVLRH